MKGFTIEGIYQQAGIHTLPHKRHLQIHLKGFQTVGIKREIWVDRFRQV